MKARFYTLLALSMLFVSCCEKPDEKTPEEADVPTDVSLSQPSFAVPKEGGSLDLTVTAPSRPSVGVIPAWVIIPDGTYNSKTYKITYKVTVAANTATSERSASVRFSAGSLYKELNITQEAAEAQDDTPKTITLDKHSLALRQEGGQASVIVTAPEAATLSGVPSWLEVSQTGFQNYKMKFTFKAGVNDSYDELSATVTVSAGSLTDQLTITQAAKFKEPDPSENDAWIMAQKLGLGWNMGNQLDAINNGVSNETCWGNPKATQATFDGVKAAGFTSVRLPVTWMGHIGAAPDYKIDEAWMNRVYEVVGYAEKAGLNVILNTHHDEDHGDGHWQDLKGAVDNAATNTRVKEEIAAVWKQIAEKFNDKGDFLVLESFNELIYGTDWSIGSNPQKKANVINEWNQVFVDAVRSTGGNNATRWLGVPGYAANPQYLQYFVLPNDDAKHVMVAFHCYDPYQYTIGEQQLTTWGHTGKDFPNGENEINDLFKGLHNTYVVKGIPIYMGEFGCSFRSKNNSKAWAYFLYYLEYMVKAAKTYGFPAFLWDNGGDDAPGKEHHGYIDHGTGQYYSTAQEPVEAMVKAWFTTDDKYTLQSVYDNAPQF